MRFLFLFLFLFISYSFISVPSFADSTIDYFQQGNLMFAEGKYNEALLLYDKSIQLNPKNPEAHYNKALCFISLSKSEEALQELDAAEKLDKNLHKINLQKGHALMLADKPKEAEKYFLEELKINRYSIEARMFLATNYLQDNSEKKAIKYFDEIIESNEQDRVLISYAYSGKANAYKQLNNLEEAMRNFEKAMEVSSENYEAVFGKSFLLFEDGKKKDAISVLEKAKKNAPFEIFLIMSVFYNDMCEYEKSLSYLKKIESKVTLPQDQYKLYVVMAECYSGLEKYNESIEYCEKAIKINDQNVEAYVNKLVAMSGLRKYDEAKKLYEMILKIDDRQANACLSYGIVQLELKNYKEAKRLFLNVSTFAAGDAKYLILSYVYSGLNAIGLDDINEANRNLDNAISLFFTEQATKKTQGLAYWGKFQVLLKQSKDSEALEFINKAIECDSENKDYIKIKWNF
jgi:tetratricopeptide (TPR) repeat protein